MQEPRDSFESLADRASFYTAVSKSVSTATISFGDPDTGPDSECYADAGPFGPAE